MSQLRPVPNGGRGRPPGFKNKPKRPKTESAIYEETLKQVGSALVDPETDEKTRLRLWLAVLGWRGKIEGNSERKQALAELLQMTRGPSGEPDPVPEHPPDQG